MSVSILKWVVVVLSLMNAGYMAYDGSRALIKGDYLRPTSGEYAGQLGPWSRLAEKAGIDPLSTGMKCVFLLFGVVGTVLTICFAIGYPWAWKALLIFNICSAWNLFFGTASSVLQIILLVIMRVLS
jgi:hypothetical protein